MENKECKLETPQQIIKKENYSICIKCPHCEDDDEGLYCKIAKK